MTNSYLKYFNLDQNLKEKTCFYNIDQFHHVVPVMFGMGKMLEATVNEDYLCYKSCELFNKNGRVTDVNQSLFIIVYNSHEVMITVSIWTGYSWDMHNCIFWQYVCAFTVIGAIMQRQSRGYCCPGPNIYIYGRPYWCSRNTFASEVYPPPPPYRCRPLVSPLLCHCNYVQTAVLQKYVAEIHES